MRVYTLLSDDTFDKMIKEGKALSPWCGHYPILNFSGTVFLKFGSKYYEDTFSKDLYDERPVFFRFAIDAIRFYKQEQDTHEYKYFCVFDIPEELLEKGFGCYGYRGYFITPMYRAKEEIKKDYFQSYTKCRQGDFGTCFDDKKLFDYIKEDLEDSVIWHSTVGKICTICIDNAYTLQPICGSKRVGGFMYNYATFRGFLSYNLGFLPNILFEATTEEEAKEILEKCDKLNRQCYDNLKSSMTEEDLSRVSEIIKQFHKREVKTQNDAANLFEEVENICYPQEKLNNSSTSYKKTLSK